MKGIRKPHNLTLSEALVAEAQDLDPDVSDAAEKGLARATKAAKERCWKIENAEAIKASNDYFTKHGLPLAKYRMF